jgi:large subunit ribosomal protein L17
VVQKLFNEIAPKFADRPGGYTRIIKLSDFRIGDGGSLVLLQLLTEENVPRGTIRRSAGLRRKRNERRRQFATQAIKKAKTEPEAVAASESKPTESQPAEGTPAAE